MISFAAFLLAATFTRPMERVATMDPAMATSFYDAHAIQLVYETPLAIDYAKRPYRLVPSVCELPEVGEDGLTYRFRVRGRSMLVAEDVVRSLERLRDPELVSPNGWIMKDVDTITAKGNEVEIRLKRRCHYFPWLMAMSAVAVRGEKGEGNGPYTLSHWRKNHEMVFKSNGRNRGFDEVRYLVIDDASTQWLMFLKGELDFLGEISRDNFDSVVDDKGKLKPELANRGIRLYSSPTFDVMYVGMNMRDPVLGSNRKLRQALNAAFNYPAWEKFYNGRISPCTTPVPTEVEGYLNTPFKYAYNLELAKKLMEEAGYPDGVDSKTGKRLVLTMAIGRASQESREAGELIAAFFEKIDIKLELNFFTWDAYLKAVNDGRVQLFRMGWVGDYPDAQNFLQLFYSNNVNPGPNHANYTNAEFDLAYEAALDAKSADERNRQWQKCQEIVREDCPWIFTHVNRAFMLVGPRVGNFIPTAFPYGNERYYENTLP